MRPSKLTRFIALAVSHLLACAPLFFPFHGSAQTNTRPRRVNQSSSKTQSENINTTSHIANANETKERHAHEPTIRIGLTTNARSVNISTTSRLMDASSAAAPPAPFEVARVRIEPRLMPPPALQATTRDELTEVADAAPSTVPDTLPKSAPAIERRTSTNSAAKNNKQGSVRLVSRVITATRGAVLFAPGATTPLLDAREPVVFASDDETQHPIRYNEKPYRGRLEVFANQRGTLTVVNVVGLEDYVRGVVPNELSPGGFPELEALKAQAIAARTYAVSNLRRFESEGFDLLPTTRSQVYGGRSTEHSLTDRAVAETRGRVATYGGAPINALYTSTCGGRTEHAENIFGGNAVPYLRARECAYEAHDAFAPHTVRTSRGLPDIKLHEHSTSARDAALLAIHGFSLPARLNDEWLSSPVSVEDVRALLGKVSALARQPFSAIPNEATQPAGFATAFANALYGENRGDALLNETDVQYHLSFKDAGELPARSRAEVALLLREGHLTLFPDATLRPRQPMSRARVLRAIAHALETQSLIQLRKATARPSTNGALIIRPAGKSADLSLRVASQAFLFRAFGDTLYPVREVSLVGGEPLAFHTDASGEVVYLEARPAPNGAAPDHFSAYSNWTVTLTPGAAQLLLGRAAAGIGTLLDLRVRSRGASRRVLDLEVIGTHGTAHVRGGRIRTALGLREQLFVIDRLQDETGKVTAFIIRGRGWGHGVGMCQVGAYGMARFGMSHEKILKSYYTGISLTRLY